MKFSYEFNQAVQAAAFLLKKACGRMSYMKLLKLLYIADREYLLTYGETITGDDSFAMKDGPVLSRIYAYIKPSPNWQPEPAEQEKRQTWCRYIQTDAPQMYTVSLIDDPGDDDLSESMEDCLASVFEKFRTYDQFDMSEYTHGFHEWQIKSVEINQNKKSVPMDWFDTLADNPKMLHAARENIRMAEADARLLQAVGRKNDL